MQPGSKPRDAHVLVFALLQRDTALICQILAEEGIAAEPVASAEHLLAAVGEGAGAVVLAEESLDQPLIEDLARVLARQPSWSDLPIIVLTSGGASTEYTELAARSREPLGNVSLLERPVRTITLASAVRSALRARNRQYDVRDELARRFEAERAVFSASQRYRSLVEATTNAVWCTDTDGRINGDMPGWEQFTGQSFAEYSGWGWIKAIQPADRDRVVAAFRSALERESPATLEFRLRHEGEYWRVRARVVPVRDEHGRVREWVAACTDIEQQKAAEEALIKSEKLAVAGRLATSIAHEINNPLEAVTNLLYLIRHSSSLAQAMELAQVAEAELARVSQIVTQTLRFYRQPSAARPANIGELLEDVLALFQRKLLSSKIELQRDFRPSAPLVCFSGELRQAFANIIANAIDAMYTGGKLKVRVREATDWNQNGRSGIRVTIVDTGPGIAGEIRPHVFEPFFTTKDGTGTGLGLWITRELVQKHGGKLHLYTSTRPGRSGCAFSLFFPHGAVAERERAGAASDPIIHARSRSADGSPQQ